MEMLVRRLAVILTVMLCGIINLSAQHSSLCPAVKMQYDTLASCTIQFRHDKAAIDSNYLDNSASLATIRAALKELTSTAPQSLASILIEGYSSPVGNDPYNQRLSLQRAQKVEAFLRAIPGLETVDMVVEGKGEDWEIRERTASRSSAFLTPISRPIEKKEKSRLSRKTTPLGATSSEII